MSELRKVGYWWSMYYPDLPRAQDYIDESWDELEREQVAAYLHAGKEHAAYKGMSRCRICNCSNGSTEQTDGTWIWPEGLLHYVTEHKLKPPEEFASHARSNVKVAMIEDYRFHLKVSKAAGKVMKGG